MICHRESCMGFIIVMNLSTSFACFKHCQQNGLTKQNQQKIRFKCLYCSSTYVLVNVKIDLYQLETNFVWEFTSRIQLSYKKTFTSGNGDQLSCSAIIAITKAWRIFNTVKFKTGRLFSQSIKRNITNYVSFSRKFKKIYGAIETKWSQFSLWIGIFCCW